MSRNGAPDKSSQRKIYFMLTFWGEKFREHFYSLLLPTLLAPGNIPVLKNWPGSKLVICTTKDDWSELQQRPLMRALREYVEPLPLFIDYPDKSIPTQLHMSSAHQLAARRAYEDGAVAGFLAPDLLCSDGLIKTAVEFIASGKRAVVCPALRFSMEKVLRRINDVRLLHPDKAAELPASFMGSVAANSLHPELLRYDFEGLEFDNYPIWSFWRVHDRGGLVMYTVSWALLLADYSTVSRFTDDTLRRSTIDAFYAWQNFGHLIETNQFALINDLSVGTFISLTPDKEFDFSAANRRARFENAFFRILRLGDARRLYEISKFYHGPDLDPWRKQLYAVPIIIHDEPIDSAYECCVERTKAKMKLAFNFQGTGQYVIVDIIFLLLRWTLTIVHMLRRVVHVLSFGLIYYPGSSGQHTRALLRRLQTKLFGKTASAKPPDHQPGTTA